MPNNGLLSINGNVIDSTPPNEIADIVADAVSKAVTDLDSTLVHKAGGGTTPEEITGIKDFSYGHDHQQDDNNPSIRAARLRITGQVSPTASQKTVSQVDFYIGNESVAYMGCTRQNGTTFIKVASNNDSAPLIFGYKPFQDNTACIRFEKGHPVWRGGQTGTYSEDKALAVVGDIDKKIDDRFSLNPPTANRVLVSDGKGKIAPSNMTVTDLNTREGSDGNKQNDKYSFNSTGTGYNGWIDCYRRYGCVFLDIYIKVWNTFATKDTWVTVYTLPAKYRPPKDLYPLERDISDVITSSATGAGYSCKLLSTGEFQIYVTSGTTGGRYCAYRDFKSFPAWD